MKKLLLSVLVALGLASASWGQTVSYAYQSPRTIFTATGTSQTLRIIGFGAAFHQISWNDTGTVATCQIQVDSSVDGVTWGSGDIIASTLCTSNGTVISTSHVVNFVRINLTVISGADATVTALLTGYANAPGGGGTVTAVTGTPPVTSSGGNTPAISCATCAIGPGTSVANHVAAFSGTDGVTLKDGGAAGSGTVTNTGGALTANALVLGAGTADTKVSPSLTTDGTANLNLGSTGVGGTLTLFGATSGSNTLTAPGNGTQLTLSAATLAFGGSTNITTAGSNMTLTGGLIIAKGGGGATNNTAFIDLLPTSSFTDVTAGGQLHLQTRGTFAPTSGSSFFTNIISNPTINQTGGANGTIRSLASYPVNTAVVGLEYLIAAGTSSASGPTGVLTDKFLVDSNGITRMGNACSIVGDITLTVNTNITICQFSLPAVSQAWSWTCDIPWVISAGSGTNTISIGVNASQTPAATTTASAQIYSTNTGTNTTATVNLSASGAVNVLTSPTITPAATVFQSHTFGTLSSSATAGTFTITMNAAGTTATALAKAGASCRLF